MKLIYCFELHLQLWNGNVNWNQIFSKLCLTELWWGEGFTLIEWWKFPMEKIELPERIIHFNIVIGSLQVTSIVAQVQRTYYNLQSLWKELHSQTNTHWLLKSERLTDDNPYWRKNSSFCYTEYPKIAIKSALVGGTRKFVATG